MNTTPNITDSHIHIRFTRYHEIERMLDNIADVGVNRACLLSLPYRGAAENVAGLYAKLKYTKYPVYSFGGLHLTDRYAAYAPEVTVKALLDMGCDGIKIMNSPDTSRFMGRGLSDARYEKMFALLEELGTPINIHVADPETFWDEGKQYHDPSFPSKQWLYDDIFNVLDRHPGLRVTFAHFFFLSNFPEEAARVMDKYPNVRFDLTPGVEMYLNFDTQLDEWREFFVKYKKRILFGTDCNTMKASNKDLVRLVYRKLTESTGLFTQKCYGRDYVVHGLELDADTVDCICRTNFDDFAGLSPKAVDKEMLLMGINRILCDLRDNPHDEYYIKGYEFIPGLADDPDQRNAWHFCRHALDTL